MITTTPCMHAHIQPTETQQSKMYKHHIHVVTLCMHSKTYTSYFNLLNSTVSFA